MKCPFCGSNQTKVVGGNQQRNIYKRYRKCLVCDASFRTREFVVEDKRKGVKE